MPLPHEVIKLLVIAYGDRNTTKIVDIADKAVIAASKCQLTGIKGVLDSYAELESVVGEIIQERLDVRIPETSESLRKMWDSVDNEIMKSLSENCSCRIK